METAVLRHVKALQHMTVGELRSRYLEVFGEATRSFNRDFLRKRIAWRIQANAWGDLSERARKRAEELANDADIRVRPPKDEIEAATPTARPVGRPFRPGGGTSRLTPGTVLAREYQGGTVQVTVLDKGFEYEGEIYRSLTAVAHAVTGAHWNGYHFFGLARKGG